MCAETALRKCAQIYMYEDAVWFIRTFIINFRAIPQLQNPIRIRAISPSVNLALGAHWFDLLPGEISCTYEFRASAHLKSQKKDKTLTLSARRRKGNLYMLGQFVRHSSSDFTLARSSAVAPVNTHRSRK